MSNKLATKWQALKQDNDTDLINQTAFAVVNRVPALLFSSEG